MRVQGILDYTGRCNAPIWVSIALYASSSIHREQHRLLLPGNPPFPGTPSGAEAESEVGQSLREACQYARCGSQQQGSRAAAGAAVHGQQQRAGHSLSLIGPPKAALWSFPAICSSGNPHVLCSLQERPLQQLTPRVLCCAPQHPPGPQQVCYTRSLKPSDDACKSAQRGRLPDDAQLVPGSPHRANTEGLSLSSRQQQRRGSSG
jgi:hypothetical protein